MCGATAGGLSLDGVDVAKESVIQGVVTRAGRTLAPAAETFLVVLRQQAKMLG